MNLIMNSRTPDDTTCFLEIEGEVDVYTSPQLKQDIVKLAEGGVKHVVINLSKVEYLDSTGLGVLIGGLKRLRESDGNLVLVGPGMRILRIFEITGLDKIFEIYAPQALTITVSDSVSADTDAGPQSEEAKLLAEVGVDQEGLGALLMEILVDDVKIDSGPGGTTVRLTKYAPE